MNKIDWAKTAPKWTVPKKSKPEEVAELLETAADKLESGELTWTQGQYKDADDRVCAFGALCEATGVGAWRAGSNLPAIVFEAAEVVRPHVKDVVMDHLEEERQKMTWLGSSPIDETVVSSECMLVTFNDQIAKDKSEVVEVFKLAAKDLRNQS